MYKRQVLSTQFLKHFGTTDDDYAKYILTWVVHNVADLKPSDVEFVFNTEAKAPEAQRLFSDIKALQKHYSIVKIGTSKPIYIQDRAFWEQMCIRDSFYVILTPLFVMYRRI